MLCGAAHAGLLKSSDNARGAHQESSSRMIIVGVRLPLLSSRHRRCVRAARSRWPRFSHVRAPLRTPVTCTVRAHSRRRTGRLTSLLHPIASVPLHVPSAAYGGHVFRSPPFISVRFLTVSYIFSTSGTARRFWNRMRLQNMHVVLERSVVREPLAGTGTPQRYWDRPGGAGTPRWYWDRPGVLGRRVVLGRWWYWEGVFQYHRAVPVPSAYQNLDWVRGRGGKVPDGPRDPL